MFYQQLCREKSKQDTLWRRHVYAFHTIWPSYLLAYMQPYPLWKICNIISQKWGGGSKAVWTFSKISSDLVAESTKHEDRWRWSNRTLHHPWWRPFQLAWLWNCCSEGQQVAGDQESCNGSSCRSAPESGPARSSSSTISWSSKAFPPQSPWACSQEGLRKDRMQYYIYTTEQKVPLLFPKPLG